MESFAILVMIPLTHDLSAFFFFFLAKGVDAVRASKNSKSWQITADREVVSKFTTGRKSSSFSHRHDAV
jgi:hypothetical protein